MSYPTADVDHFLATLDHSLTDVVVRVRAVILAADTKITEQIKWKEPSFCYHT